MVLVPFSPPLNITTNFHPKHLLSMKIMDQTAVTGEINLFFLLLLLLPLLLLILKHIRLPSLKDPSLPPGPFSWPIIGNILQMGKKPHLSLAYFAQIHGPLISLRLGTQLLVVGSSPVAATEILKTHDRLFSARYVPHVAHIKSPDLNHLSLFWSFECTDKWKFLRTICRTELFSAKAIESQLNLRERKVNEMVGFVGTKEGKVVKIGELVFTTIFNILSNLFFSKDFIDFEDEGLAGGMKGTFRRMMELGSTPNLADFYPILGGLDLQGLTKISLVCMGKVCGLWEVLIKERRESNCHDVSRQLDFLDVLLSNGFMDDQINQLILELFTAGTDTSSSTVEWAMAELLKNQETMNKVHEELRREVKENIVRESDLPQLPYLHACVKETLRLHPPAPFLLPRRAPNTCKVMNYTIPKDSQVLLNVWAIGRDPTTWDDPLTFRPERFLNSDVDFKGNNFEFVPFGGGRRICAGLPMATKQVHLILASLIHCFNWSLPHNADPAQLDMNEKFGITLQKEQPLLLIPKQKN